MRLTLKAARVNKNLTQKQAASYIGVTRDTLSNWERYKSCPNARYIADIERTYGVVYNDIIFLPSNDA